MCFRIARGRAQTILAGALLVVLVATPVAGGPADVTGELVVADQRAGIALFGFDPVAYFLNGAAEPGSESIELPFAGFTWRFRSEANRAAFRARPDVYVPQFGGYDPLALSRGAPVAGHPANFSVLDGRLFLFQRQEHRAAFLANPRAAIEAAQAKWPETRRSLVH